MLQPILPLQVNRRQIVHIQVHLVLVDILVVGCFHLADHFFQVVELLGHFFLNFLSEMLALRQSLLDLLRIQRILIVKHVRVSVFEHLVNVAVEKHVLSFQLIKLLLDRFGVPLDLHGVEPLENNWQKVSLGVNYFNVLLVEPGFDFIAPD